MCVCCNPVLRQAFFMLSICVAALSCLPFRRGGALSLHTTVCVCVGAALPLFVFQNELYKCQQFLCFIHKGAPHPLVMVFAQVAFSTAVACHSPMQIRIWTNRDTDTQIQIQIQAQLLHSTRGSHITFLIAFERSRLQNI